ncbi:MAG: glycosyltransferase family 4 protein, partial [Candidatus Paceibacterota bacterium]
KARIEPMRILIATGLYFPEIGGPATHTSILERELPKHGYEVSVVPFSRVKRLPKGVRHFAYFFLLFWKGFRARIVYALDPVSVGLPASIMAFILRKKFILRVPGDYAWEQAIQRAGIQDAPHVFAKRSEGYPAFIMRLKEVQKFVAKRATIIIAPSKYLEDVIVSWGIERKKIKLVHSALNGMPSKGNRRTLRGLLRFHGKFIVTSGRLVPWKGFELLIDVVDELKEKIPEIKLMIIGSGPDEVKLERKIEEKNLEEYVVLARPVERDVLVRYIQAADLFVLNTFYEGFSHQILEAMCMGTPIITTKVGGNPELIKDGENGLLVKYNDKKELKKAVETLLFDAQRSKRLAERAEKDVLSYTDEHMVKKLVPLLS